MKMRAAAAAALILGLAALIFVGIGLWIVAQQRGLHAYTLASEACTKDPEMKRAPLGSPARADAYERCLVNHGVPRASIPKRTDYTN